MPRNVILLVLFAGMLVFALHVPFLSADPDIHISDSRGPNTDEGLNTCQIRNYVNHGDLTFNKSDNLVKTPLFSAFLFLPFQMFGTYLPVARLTVLLFSLAICFFVFKVDRYYTGFGVVTFIVILTEYYVFHFFHYALSEMLSTVLILLSIFILTKYMKNANHLQSVFLSATFISIAWYLKVQFIYAVLILPLTLLIIILISPGERKALFRKLIYLMGFLFSYLLFYYLIWYLPNKSFYDYVMLDQTGGRFVSFSGLMDYLDFVLHYIFYNSYLKWFTLSFYVLFIAGLLIAFTNKSQRFRFLFIGLSCWLLIELHKLPMTYLPTRYLISLIFPMGMIMSLVLWEFLQLKIKRKSIFAVKAIVVLMLFSLGAKNAMDYYTALQNREFNIRNINNYLAKEDFGKNPIIGSWAPSLTWKSKAVSFPVWKNYFNDKDVLDNYKPAVIITEWDEEDSGGAYSSNGIVIDTYADSIKYFKVNRWSLKILWIKTDQK
jgi:hypothetical protein